MAEQINLIFNGRPYRLRFKERMRDFGHCDDPETPDREITIRKNQPEEEMLKTLLHEMIHAEFWDLSEEAVSRAEKNIGGALWALGYRRTSPSSPTELSGGS